MANRAWSGSLSGAGASLSRCSRSSGAIRPSRRAPGPRSLSVQAPSPSRHNSSTIRPQGQKGGAPPPSQQRPQTTRMPFSAACSARTPAGDVLPDPGLPASMTKRPRSRPRLVQAPLSCPARARDPRRTPRRRARVTSPAEVVVAWRMATPLRSAHAIYGPPRPWQCRAGRLRRGGRARREAA